MFAEFKHALRRLRGRVIGWSIGLALYGVMMVFLFDEIGQIEGIDELFGSYPPELMAFFGGAEMGLLTTPVGYLDIYYFSYVPIIVGIFIVAAAAGLFAGDEEKGLLDLVLAHPIGRTALFWGRVAALVVATAIILMVSWLSWTLPSGMTSMELTWLEFLRPFVPLFAELLLFGGLALLLSLVLPSSRAAAMISAALLIANFLLLGLAGLNENLETLSKFTPLYYEQGGDAVPGIDWPPVFGLLVVAVLLTLAGWYLFQERDIRVGGERTWSLRGLFRSDRVESEVAAG